MVQIAATNNNKTSFKAAKRPQQILINSLRRRKTLYHQKIIFGVVLGIFFLIAILYNNSSSSSDNITVFDTDNYSVLTDHDQSSSSQQTKKKKRVSYEELHEIMSPPGIDPSTVPRVNGMMVKCDIERWSGYLRREHYYIYDGLVQIYGWKEINLDQVRMMAATATSTNNNNEQNEEQQLPDVLFLCEPSILHLNHLLPWLRQIKQNKNKKKVHIAYHTDDLTSLMNKVETEQLAEAFNDIFDTYMGTYAYRIEHYLQQVPINSMPKIVWIPHSVSPEFIISNNNNNNDRAGPSSQIINNNNSATIKRNKILLPGKINNQYPLRQWAEKEYMAGNLPMLEILPHSGYSWDHGQNQQLQFANQLASYATAFTCGLFYHYIVAKMFEIPAVGTLMLVNNDISNLLEALGFVDGQHYKSYNSMNPKPTFEWVVNPQNFDIVDQIRQSGMDLIRTKHQVGHRVYAIATYFATGQIIYPIPKSYKNNPCPMITKPNINKCMEEFTKFATKPLLPVK